MIIQLVREPTRAVSPTNDTVDSQLRVPNTKSILVFIYSSTSKLPTNGDSHETRSQIPRNQTDPIAGYVRDSRPCSRSPTLSWPFSTASKSGAWPYLLELPGPKPPRRNCGSATPSPFSAPMRVVFGYYTMHPTGRFFRL